jgi:hypothetical protein
MEKGKAKSRSMQVIVKITIKWHKKWIYEWYCGIPSKVLTLESHVKNINNGISKPKREVFYNTS